MIFCGQANEMYEYGRDEKNGHDKWYVPVNHDSSVPVVTDGRENDLIIDRIFGAEIKFRKGNAQPQGLENRENGKDEVGNIDVFELLYHEFPVVELGVENMMEQKSGNEDKKRCSAADQIRQHTLAKGFDEPA